MAEVEAILQSRELAEVQTPIAQAIGLKILESRTTFQRHALLRFIDLDAPRITRLLVEWKDDLISFETLYQRQELHRDDEEFPHGEELAGNDKPVRIEVLGIENGFGIVTLCHLYLLRQKSADELDFFLQMEGIPSRKKLASRMRKYIKEIDKVNHSPETTL